MRRTALALIILTAPLAACGGDGSNATSQVTETRIDDLDSLEGTISDELADTATINEQPVIDASSPEKPSAKKEPSKAPVKAEPAAKPGE
jgi:hypothetical protein